MDTDEARRERVVIENPASVQERFRSRQKQAAPECLQRVEHVDDARLQMALEQASFAVMLTVEMHAFIDGADIIAEQRREGLKGRRADQPTPRGIVRRSDEHTSELQSLMSNSYAVFCLKHNKLDQTIKSDK